jgi:hypothetical protein
MKIALVHALLIAGIACFPTYFDTHIEGTTKIMGIDFDASCQCSSNFIFHYILEVNQELLEKERLLK